MNNIKSQEDIHEELKDVAKSKSTKFGLMIAGAVVFTHIMVFISGEYRNTSALLIPEILLVLGVFVSNILFRKNMKNVTFFAELFGNGFKTTCLICIFIILWTFASIHVFPEIKVIDVEVAKGLMIKEGYTPEELQEALNLYADNKIYYLGKIMNIFKLDFMLGILTALFSAMLFRSRSAN